MANSCIGCNVIDCKHHAKTVNQCTLDHIDIVMCGNHAMTQESTDCASFQKG